MFTENELCPSPCPGALLPRDRDPHAAFDRLRVHLYPTLRDNGLPGALVAKPLGIPPLPRSTCILLFEDASEILGVSTPHADSPKRILIEIC